MAPKILWVALPLLLYAAWLVVARWRGRAPARMALNVHTSVLLLCYLLSTAGLGIFWVANQQLPVFDWHYLFGYATLLLVFIHLTFNLPLVLNWLRRRAPARPVEAAAGGAPALGVPLAIVAGLVLAFFLGMRQGAGGSSSPWDGKATPNDGATAATAGGAGAAAVLRYHELSSESRGSVFMRAPGIAWGDAPPAFKQYPQARHVILPTARPAAPANTQPLAASLRGPAAGPRGRPRLDELAQILYLTAGVTAHRGGRALRAAPSSGALFPSELYVAARAVDGLAPGLYHYDPERHRLALLDPSPAMLGAPEADDADALLVLSAIFRRTGYKYHNRAYRYATADAGHLLENLRLASHQAGMLATLLPRFDEALAARALAIDGVEEGVLAMMALRRPARAGDSMVSTAQAKAAPPAQVYAPAPAPRDTALGATGVIQQATSLRLETETALPPTAVRLPAAAASAADTHKVITQRRSVRRYSAGPVPLASLSAILAGMAQPPQLSDAIRVELVVNRVEGLEPGVYRYLPGHALLPLATGDFAARARRAALEQDVIGDAAVVLILSADTARLLARGARGYRHAFLEAGLVGERWLLGAVAQGLAACPVGAFYDDDAARLVGARGHWVLHFAALGRP
ncbi:SagB/ThcOx family dehydrogenase [Pseudoduganella namucuonensis]|uniref:SagB-type dehydrogenase domain-containing protein n=1 Tax=Pseudoduganella namucuonensis TaxID=1035707 RepID=A0A1I7J646_9BURK|nr:SagB/ThcOx family dehydrogenase [Pseudoduganella namucuonensis]SFU80689.1 SagB-type dehydrogenase domain-containing protein [Pseudoduganella namucuonensis]